MKSIKRIWNSFKIAFSMYSKIPMPQSEWTDENKSYAMCFFPWIGAVIGLLSYGVFRFSKWFDGNGGGNYSLFFVIFLILIPVFITGGIHLDGFLDTQDALSSWQTKERRLEILKDSHAGAFAIISCTVYFLMYIGVYSCLSVRSMEVIAYSFMLSRTLSGLSVVTFPQARKKGMVADFSESASTRITRMVLGIYLIVLCFLIPLTGGICGIGCVISAGVVYGYYYRMAMKNFGGVTGDLCGYFLQVCELVMALVVVVVDIVVKSGIIK